MNKAKRIKEIIGYICICVEVVAGWFIIYIAKEGFIPVYKDYGWNIPGPTKILLWFTSQPLFSTPFFSLSICILLIFDMIRFRKLTAKPYFLSIIIFSFLFLLSCATISLYLPLFRVNSVVGG